MPPGLGLFQDKTAMKNHSDLSFITNERDQSLLERFKVLIQDTKFFDALAGYFYTSGFHALYKSLRETKKIRILIGISSDKETAAWITSAEKQQEFQFSYKEAKQRFSEKLKKEMENSSDTKEVCEGVLKFMEWLRSGKLEIRIYPSRKLHAKLYIMTFAEGDRDRGRVITGSSNFTKAGLIDNMEFNVELKNPSDYEFALQKFNDLWQDAIEAKDTYLKTIQTGTWLNDSISPYELYLKFLYEHFKEDLREVDESSFRYMPQDFKQLEYQIQAVQNAKRILLEYGGVFLSDVVGLGKTYMSAMLAGRLNGRSLVLAPPLLLGESHPGSWPNVFSDFNVPADFESLGKLDKALSRGTDRYKNVFIDEAHRFRRETNITYEKLAQICRGKRLVLVTATPFNNSPRDILSQIKLFQNAKKSAIPNVPNLELFFGQLEKKTKNLNKKENYAEYIQVVKENSKKIRESVLKYLMVRRTRKEVETHFADDLKNQAVKFPEVKNPEPLYYQFNGYENRVFHKTVELIGKKLKYARYMPLTYCKKQDQLRLQEIQSQKNLGVFMKILLVKRLESGFHAFQNSIRRFINSYERFLREFNRGNVYVSKAYINKIFDFLDDENEEAVQKLLDEDKADKYPVEDFNKQLKKDLESDLEVLRDIKSLWRGISRDPKLLAFTQALSGSSPLARKNLAPEKKNLIAGKSPATWPKALYDSGRFSALRDKKNKLIVFTESKETAEYLGEELNKRFPNEVLVFTGSSKASVRESIIQNFDPKAFHPKEDYRILVATDVLAEGVNLHRSNMLVNYDIPWNPTRLMQRVGRINRVDTKFQEIHTFNFFPTEQSNDVIKLEETAKAKIEAFINLLGADARLLTEEEIVESHNLFGRLGSKKTLIGEEDEDESELRYLKIIKDIRDKDPDLFNKIKQLPKKARTAKKHPFASAEAAGRAEGTGGPGGNPKKGDLQRGDPQEGNPPLNKLLTYFRKGKLNKFCLTEGEESRELDFISSAKLLSAEKDTPKEALGRDFFILLEQNKEKFYSLTTEDEQPFVSSRFDGGDSASKLFKTLKIIQKDLRQFTWQEAYFQKVISRIEEGALPKQTIKTALKALEKEIQDSSGSPRPLKILALLQYNIPDTLLQSHVSKSLAVSSGLREVILSEYLIKD